MERGSDKHNPRLDEQMKRETIGLQQGAPVEPRAEEFREMEPPGDDQPLPDARINGSDRPSDSSLASDEAEERSTLARHVEGAVFPADRGALVESARGMNAPSWLLQRLQDLPDGRRFENVQEVWEALGGRVEQRF